jgi:hypothetical protein
MRETATAQRNCLPISRALAAEKILRKDGIDGFSMAMKLSTGSCLTAAPKIPS